MSTREPPRAEHWEQTLLSNLCLSFSSLPTSFSWQMIWRGTAHAAPNPSYLAEDHTDGPDWASWTHRQLGVMMHRMLPINRMYCSAEASQADTPDRAAEGGPAKRPKRTGGTEREQLDQEEGFQSAEWRVEVGNEGRERWINKKNKINICMMTQKELWGRGERRKALWWVVKSGQMKWKGLTGRLNMWKEKVKSLKRKRTTKDRTLYVFPGDIKMVREMEWEVWVRVDCCWHFIKFTTRSYYFKSFTRVVPNDALMKQANAANCKCGSSSQNCFFFF